MDTTIVVSRYNEDIEWTRQFDNLVLYNKGSSACAETEIKLPNVGREGHTYYTYIYDNYDNLPDYMVFLQGNPFDHSPNIISDLKNIIQIENKPEFLFLGNQLITYMNKCPIKDSFQDHMIRIYKELFSTEIYSQQIIFTPGAQFMVSKKNILNRPREFYYKILKFLDYSSNPIEGYVIEIFHKLIFTKD